MQTVIDYADEVFDVMDFNKVYPLVLDDNEVEWLVKCHKHGDTARDCAYGIGDGRDAYTAAMKIEHLYWRIDAQLKRAA